MKRRNGDQHLEVETKKEYIIRVAKEDPFLKIEEISELAETTPRYVRTILSEANLSLMNLREEYARKMEKSLESKILFSVKDPLKVLRLHTEEGDKPIFTYGNPRKITVPNSTSFRWNKKHLQLFQYNQCVYYHEKPFCIIVFLTGEILDDEQLSQNISTFRLVGLKVEETRLTGPEIEVGKFSDYFPKDTVESDFFGDCTTFKIRTLVSVKDRVFGEEFFFFPTDYIKLTIPGPFSPTLELVQDG